MNVLLYLTTIKLHVGMFDYFMFAFIVYVLFSDTADEAPTASKTSKRRKKETPKWKKDFETFSNPLSERTATVPLEEKYPELNDISMVEMFEKMFPSEIVELTASETNRYANQKNDHTFTTTPDEIWKFIGLLILSGFNVRKHQRHYWEKADEVCCPVVQKAMSREHFKKLKSYFHFVNNDDIRANETNMKNRMFKLQPVIDTLNKAWMQFGTFETDVCIDEQMVPYYGHNSIKQFMKGKPVRYGYKIWMLCSSSGYCYQFDIYCGKKSRPSVSDDHTDLPLGSKVVMDLLDCVPDKKAINVCFDNFFTSHHLLKLLREDDVQATGTARVDRMRLGSCALLTKDASRGDYVNYSDGDVNVVQWKDCKNVCVASNYEAVTPTGTCQRRIVGQKEKVSLPQPRMIATYNAKMGGVDLLDKLISLYRIRIYSKKWYWRIINNLISVACVNAWRLFLNTRKMQPKELPLLNFLREISVCLLRSTPRPITGPRSQLSEVVRFDGFHHWPMEKQAQKRCAYCKKNTSYKCEKCDINLHIACFKAYHLK